MQLAIETFSNAKGGNSFYKAATHPMAAPLARALIGRLGAGGRVAVYDPLGFAAGFAAIHDLGGLSLAGVFVQDVDAVGRTILGRSAQPVTDLAASRAETVLIAAFDAAR